MEVQTSTDRRRPARPVREALIAARRQPATPERIYRLRELQTAALIMIETLKEEVSTVE